ncbi:Lrp/AsnC family transcriptional regulator [Actinotalea sp. M2MS4P-6]|uniref:Lrp/AsnC family transcriptional regulator n=1 Tax=Actinotalea sp. M2MS4P-6 TaxID=2983762 RepID=UPI0021E36963|nr:Lrp/AsnC family transcriptional regulator [Actinotalea sp. M2MS4P-6]MCV2393151.1 Lrp/AsnC family transcriptional regulator [Actinotalea sp. M2MS4P-6]
MDATDELILRELTADARLPFRELGARAGLSANAAAARVRRLQAEGVIAGFTVRRGPSSPAARTGLEVFVDVRMREGVSNDEANRLLAGFPEILDAAHVTGPYDYLVHAVVPDAAGLDTFVRRLKSEAGAAQTSTRLALRSPAR